MLVGHGRAGKDVGGEYLESISHLKFAGTTSKYLCQYVADEMGVSWDEAYATRHANRMRWYEIGNRLRDNDPGVLIRAALKCGEITGGVRDKQEIVHARQTGLINLIVWVENNRVPVDPTVMFSAEDCDLVIENNTTLEDYFFRLKRLATFAGILR